MANDNLHDGLPALLNVDNLANGALYELLGEAMGNVAKNISDPNTSEKARRSIKITLEATPYPDRSGFTYNLKVDTKLAGMKPAEGTAYIARKNGEYLVVGKNHKQMEMELAAAEPARIDDRPSRPQ